MKILSCSSIVDRAFAGSYYLFIDRNEQRISSLIDELIVKTELSLIGSVTERKNMDSDEEKRDLGEWYTYMERDPKLTWNAVYKLAKKM